MLAKKLKLLAIVHVHPGECNCLGLAHPEEAQVDCLWYVLFNLQPQAFVTYFNCASKDELFKDLYNRYLPLLTASPQRNATNSTVFSNNVQLAVEAWCPTFYLSKKYAKIFGKGMRSSQSEKPTAGTGRSAPRMLNSRS